MQNKVAEVKPNHKSSYTNANGTFYVHGVIFEASPGVIYDYHSKTADCKKITPGSWITYDALQPAKSGDAPRIKLATVQLPPATGATFAPSQVQVPAKDISVIVATARTKIWLSVFQSLCTLKSSTLTHTADQIADHVDAIIEKYNLK